MRLLIAATVAAASVVVTAPASYAMCDFRIPLPGGVTVTCPIGVERDELFCYKTPEVQFCV